MSTREVRIAAFLDGLGCRIKIEVHPVPETWTGTTIDCLGEPVYYPPIGDLDPEIACPACEGTGLCPSCQGNGLCGRCAGSGDCPECQGDGIRSATYDWCEACEATGTCTACGGQGECQECDQGVCPTCNGCGERIPYE